MLSRITFVAAIVALAAGVLLYPRPDSRVSPSQIVYRALSIKQPDYVPVAECNKRLKAGCQPILEGASTVAGEDAWAVRLKIPPPAKYPWIELWIDKNSSRVLAWKEWGVRDGRVRVLGQYPPAR